MGGYQGWGSQSYGANNWNYNCYGGKDYKDHCGGKDYGYGSTFVLIVVLFILLIIVGATFVY